MAIQRILATLIALLLLSARAHSEGPQTVALWLFDEQRAVEPSSLLNSVRSDGLQLVLGRGGHIVPGRFGNALEPIEPAPLQITNRWAKDQQVQFGLVPPAPLPGRRTEPLTWENAHFCAMLTVGEKHLRKMEFANPTLSRLNLGDFQWTVEFWFQAAKPSSDEGVVFEIGSGPRGENNRVTRLTFEPRRDRFRLVNQPAQLDLEIPTEQQLADGRWRHVAFAYEAANQRLYHWVDGRLHASPEGVVVQSLPSGEESYFSVGRDGLWQRPLPGRLDELRFSTGVRYVGQFAPPGSFSRTYGERRQRPQRMQGPPLLFAGQRDEQAVIELGRRKHLFLDDALVAESTGVAWTANPPDVDQLVSEEIHGHLSVVQDDDGLIRIYGSGPRDSLVVYTSRDGIRFEKPDLGRGEYHGSKNVVIRLPVGLGGVFRDPNAEPQEQWKYISGIRGQGIFVFSSADGFQFHRHETAALPFSAGSQSNVFYDDQRQLYVGYHRTDYGTPSLTADEMERRFVLSEVDELLKPWPYTRATRQRTREVAQRLSIKSHKLDPWFLENGPLSPSGIGIELPVAFARDDALDPPHTDIFGAKGIKYEFAPDAYVAFPQVYFHYWDVDDPARAELGLQHQQRGSGVFEVQTMVSRDGVNWQRYPRPPYFGIGKHADRGELLLVGMAAGMVRRGDQIWQYVAGTPDYHSAWQRGQSGGKPGVFRLIQRLDGFVSADFDYRGGRFVTRPLRIEGSQLELNIDTGATGFAQVGILNEDGTPLDGLSTDQCVYINGNSIRTSVEWLRHGADLTHLSGRVVRLEFRARGAKLYALQFVDPPAPPER